MVLFFKCISLLCPLTSTTSGLILALLPPRTALMCLQSRWKFKCLCKCVWVWSQTVVRVCLPATESPSSQDSNSLSLLTEISGVEAPVPLGSGSVLQSLASGLPGWRGEAGSRWGWWWRPWREPLGELSEGRREGSCCSLHQGTEKRRRVRSLVFKSASVGADLQTSTATSPKLVSLTWLNRVSLSFWVITCIKCGISEIPVLCWGSSVSLPAVLEPVPDLRRCEPGGLGEVAFPGRIRIWILEIPLS